MPMIYIDKQVLEQQTIHPAYELNVMSPYYEMKRFGGLLGDSSIVSTFRWNKECALTMYNWYCEQYPSCDITDEFGVKIYRSDWQRIIKASHYLDENNNVSSETIEEAWLAEEATKLAKERPTPEDYLEERCIVPDGEF